VIPAARVYGTGFLPSVEGYHFLIPEVEAAPGDAVLVEIQGLHEQSAQGFSLGVRYPSQDLVIDSIHIRDTILEAIETDFVQVFIHPEEGFFTAGVLVDTLPPFDGALIPNIFRPLTFLNVEARVRATAATDLVLRFTDGLSRPPVANLYVVDNQSIQVSELGEGVVRVRVPEPEPLFLRGDSNADAGVDVSDAITILRYRFLGTAEPPCMDAADANDDSAVDVSDAVFVLAFLFQGQRSPPPPASRPGLDPTRDALGCEEPVAVAPR
jgi:hypothetical protein